ncbi:hypothetical protein NIES2104_40490 [Leptolyngbya sp. NIES-2104]|nr:hypothetical protein NIES2104_40490 [Leptolyngbya sp. NIES-2104]
MIFSDSLQSCLNREFSGVKVFRMNFYAIEINSRMPGSTLKSIPFPIVDQNI